MANVLVLGGTSWLGGEIAKAAVARLDHVTCLARGEAGDVPAGVTFVSADRGKPDAYDEVIDQRWDSVFEVSWQPAFVREAVEILGQVSSHWAYVSSGSVYADQSVGGDEDRPIHDPLEGDEADWSTYGPAKAACEQIVQSMPHTLIARAGLLGGAGDRSDRFGYWVSRFALAGDGPVLVPDVPHQPTQTLDARDLAIWLVNAAGEGTTGIFNAAGEQRAFGDVIDAAATAADFSGEKVFASPGWLVQQEVEMWGGPRSLPLWVSDHDGMGSQDDARILEAGLQRRPFDRMLAETLDYERSLGLDRARKAGLTREDELDLVLRFQNS